MFDGYSDFKSAIFATLSDFGIYQQNTYFENNHIFLGEISLICLFLSQNYAEICNHLYP